MTTFRVQGRGLTYSKAEDAEIIRLRELGVTWDGIRIALGRQCSIAAIESHARRLNLARPPKPEPERPEVNPRTLAGHDPLPAMHPISWGAIALEGVPVDG